MAGPDDHFPGDREGVSFDAWQQPCLSEEQVTRKTIHARLRRQLGVMSVADLQLVEQFVDGLKPLDYSDYEQKDEGA